MTPPPHPRPYHNYVEQLVAARQTAAQIRPRDLPDSSPPPPLRPDSPKAMIFAPHPDDEVIMGALPLRLARQCGWQVINVAVTLGSNKGRQQARLEEAEASCQTIGFHLHVTDECGLENITLNRRRKEPEHWRYATQLLADLMEQWQPRALFYPHAMDMHPTHIGTHYLVQHALQCLTKGFSCSCFETEYWQPMASPNLLVQSSPEEVGDMVTALSRHRGEVVRNPYHLTLPAWMMDNARRCPELISGLGSLNPEFLFATPYRYRRWQHGCHHEAAASRSPYLPHHIKPDTLISPQKS